MEESTKPYTILKVGDKVKRHGGRTEFTVTKVENEWDDWVYINGSCNAMHMASLFRVDQKPRIIRDKDGKTAGEKAAEIFMVGVKAVYQILGDIWVVVDSIDKKTGRVTAHYLDNDQHVKAFRAEIWSNGEWTWVEVGVSPQCYTLRPYTGAFSEYDN